MSRDFENSMAQDPDFPTATPHSDSSLPTASHRLDPPPALLLSKEDFSLILQTVTSKTLTEGQAFVLSEQLSKHYPDCAPAADPSSGPSPNGDRNLDLRTEVGEQLRILKAMRKSYFHRDGSPRNDIDPSLIKTYLTSGVQMMNVLNTMGESLRTDADVRKIELAIENSIEEFMATDHPTPSSTSTKSDDPSGDDPATLVSTFVTMLSNNLTDT